MLKTANIFGNKIYVSNTSKYCMLFKVIRGQIDKLLLVSNILSKGRTFETETDSMIQLFEMPL